MMDLGISHREKMKTKPFSRVVKRDTEKIYQQDSVK
jgi:hypothetical protein